MSELLEFVQDNFDQAQSLKLDDFQKKILDDVFGDRPQRFGISPVERCFSSYLTGRLMMARLEERFLEDFSFSSARCELEEFQKRYGHATIQEAQDVPGLNEHGRDDTKDR